MSSLSAEEKKPGLSLRDVSKQYGRERILKSLSFDLFPGQLTLLLGQNGAGKSTLLRIAAGLSRADTGVVEYGGDERRPTIGYIGHQNLLYSALTVKENLALAAKLGKRDADISSELQYWDLDGCGDRAVSDLSKGQQFRAGLSRALLHRPKLILLDEPTAALDDSSVKLLFEKLKLLISADVAPAVLIATHDVARLENYARRVIVLADGAMSADSLQRNGTSDVRAAVDQYRKINR
jgi:ABC-type multidrug transport system ATPase subunit